MNIVVVPEGEGEETYLEEVYEDMGWERPPFSRSLSRSTRPPLQYFSVQQDPHFNQQSQNFCLFVQNA